MYRLFYLLRHIEPAGFRSSLIGLTLIPLLLGLQFTLLPDDRWNQAIYEPLKELMPIRAYGVLWILFATWMILQVRFVSKTVLAFTLLYSASWWLFWCLLFTLAAAKAHGTFVGATLFLGMSWWTWAASQTSAKGQVKVNGPKSAEYQR